MTPKISVIVPVYNADKYLRSCIESIINQTFNDFEVILIDDGSTDTSATICRSYAETNQRITVITQPNSGVSSARNVGLQYAIGQWVTFIDSDDSVAPDYLAMLSKAANHGVDWVTSGIIQSFADGTTMRQKPTPGVFTTDNSRGMIAIAAQELVTSPVAKLYSNELISNHELRFDTTMQYAEDRDFNVRYIATCHRCATIDYCGYYYRRDISNSLSTIKSGYSLHHDIDYWTKLNGLFQAYEPNNPDLDKYLTNRLFHLINDYIATQKVNKAELNKIDLHFLQKNRHYVTANLLIKKLITGGYFRLLNFIYSVKRK